MNQLKFRILSRHHCPDFLTNLVIYLVLLLGSWTEGAFAASAAADDWKLESHFEGRVTDTEGKPVRGASVFVVPEPNATSQRGPVRVKTDDEGRFSFDAQDMTFTDLDGLPTRRAGMLIAAADGFAPDWRNLKQGNRKGKQLQTEFELQLVKDDVAIRGQLIDHEGNSVEDARVRLSRLEVPLKDDLDAFLDKEAKRSRGSGFLTRTNFNRALYFPNLLPKIETEVETQMDGSFELRGLGRDRLAYLDVVAPPLRTTRLTVMTREAPDVGTIIDQATGEWTQKIHGADFTFQMAKGHQVSGRIVDRDTKQPIAGMLVGIGNRPLSPTADGDWKRTTLTNAGGRFTLDGLYPPPHQGYTITAASPPGLAYWQSVVQVDGDKEAVIQCQRAIPYRLELTDSDGIPVNGNVQYINFSSHSRKLPEGHLFPNTQNINATKQSDGVYEGLIMPGPGALLVTATDGRYARATVDLKKSFETEDPSVLDNLYQRFFRYREHAAIILVNEKNALTAKPLELSAVLQKAKPRRVSLLDPDDKPVVGVHVRGLKVNPNGGEPKLREASFPLRGLGSSEKIYLSFLHRGIVSGRVVDQTGRPIAKIIVQLKPKQGKHRWLVAKTDGEGKFRIEKLIPGQPYRVGTFNKNDHGQKPLVDDLEVKPGEERALGDLIRPALPSAPKPSGATTI